MGSLKSSSVRAALAAVGLVLALVCVLARLPGRPLIRELGIEAIHNVDGEVVLVYRYAVNGEEGVVFLGGEDQVREYREYLSRFGRFDGSDRWMQR